MIDRLATLLVRRSGLVVALAALGFALAAVLASGLFPALANGGFNDPGSESAKAEELALKNFGNQNADVVVVYKSSTEKATTPAFREEVRQTLAAVPADKVAKVVTYYDTVDRACAAPRSAACKQAKDSTLLSKDGHSTRVLISLAGGDASEYLESYQAIKTDLGAENLDTKVTGFYPIYEDVTHTTETDQKRAEILSAPVVLLLSLWIFGSAVAALMPVLVGVFAVVGAMAAVRIIAEITDVSVLAVNMITFLSLGLAVDYALFVVTRFREELAARPLEDPDAVPQAVHRTMATAGKTVLFSGLTVSAAMAALLVFPHQFLKSMGYGGMCAVLVAMLTTLTVLPAVLRLLGRRVDAGRVPFLNRRNADAAEDPEAGKWARLARTVMRRPVLWLGGLTAGLFVLAIPFLSVVWGGTSYHVLPEDSPSRIASEQIAADFGEDSSQAPIYLAGTEKADVDSYVETARAVPGVAAVSTVAQASTAGGGSTLLEVSWQGENANPGAKKIVRELRGITLGSGTAYVGGITADHLDLTHALGAYLPVLFLVVLAAMLVLMFLAFGSVLLPLKAILTSAISIIASFGVVTWIFGDGHLEGLLNFESTGTIEPTQVVVMMVTLFALSMDYEVFLLSRVREEWDACGDNDRAVAVGLQRTGRIITSAALLLGVVIGAFGTADLVFMKMIGVGMLVALMLDATVVRAMLVPAAMKLMGRLNWWAPAPMLRWWEGHGFRHH